MHFTPITFAILLAICVIILLWILRKVDSCNRRADSVTGNGDNEPLAYVVLWPENKLMPVSSLEQAEHYIFNRISQFGSKATNVEKRKLQAMCFKAG